MTEMDIPWPSINDEAFKEVPFSPTDACLEWIISNEYGWAITASFKEAANKIVDDLATGKISEHADIFFFPVAYLYRHSIELSLKELIWQGMQLGILEYEKVKDLLGSHNLHNLWNKVNDILKTVCRDGNKDDLAALAAVERTILQLHKIDESGQGFRYLKDKKGKSLFQKLPQRVDLENLKKVMEGLFNFFEGYGCVLSEVEN